ncbi:gp53-like domain-containing protein [Brucella haematophila]|uniref:gp53-like domain-containing protein n=1 Tax=Brucella haematophila TaxID=419474 RepID=UPI001AEF31DB|nr:hypothetical protein [Brucella haematophila]
MTILSDYVSGTISLANGSVTVTGTGTLFEVTQFREGDTLQIQNLTAVIASVDSNTQLTLTEPWTGASIVNGAYRARQLGDGSRVSTQAATIIELLGNGILANIAELGVEESKVLIGGPTGEWQLKDQGKIGIQDPNGSLGKLAALTLAANKILNTDASGDLTQSDITATAISLLAAADPASARLVLGAFASAGGDISGQTNFTGGTIQLGAAGGTRTLLRYDGTISYDGGTTWYPIYSAGGTGFVMMGAQGYIVFPNLAAPNRLTIQWGYDTGSGDRTITYPIAFANNYTVIPAISNGAGSDAGSSVFVAVSAFATTGFTIRPRYINGTSGPAIATQPVGWIAVGRT